MAGIENQSGAESENNIGVTPPPRERKATDHTRQADGSGAFRTMGVDPGTLAAGYAVLENELRPKAICYGTIKCPQSMTIENRLKHLRDQLSKIIGQHRPDVVAIEKPFVGRNPRTSLAVGQAQAAAFIAAADHGVPIAAYAAATVKLHAAGNGQAAKAQVSQMVSAILEIPSPESDDAADALAVALCHLNAMAEERTLSNPLPDSARALRKGRAKEKGK